MSADPQTVLAEYPHDDRELSLKLGLPQKELRAVRGEQLVRSVDWQLVRGAVRYSKAGLRKLLGALKISPVMVGDSAPNTAPAEGPGPAADPQKISAEAPKPPARVPGAQEQLVAWKIFKPNTRILEAKTGDGELVLVRVKDNRFLQKGMVMKCRYAGGRLWELAQRLPRRRGRW